MTLFILDGYWKITARTLPNLRSLSDAMETLGHHYAVLAREPIIEKETALEKELQKEAAAAYRKWDRNKADDWVELAAALARYSAATADPAEYSTRVVGATGAPDDFTLSRLATERVRQIDGRLQRGFEEERSAVLLAFWTALRLLVSEGVLAGPRDRLDEYDEARATALYPLYGGSLLPGATPSKSATDFAERDFAERERALDITYARREDADPYRRALERLRDVLIAEADAARRDARGLEDAGRRAREAEAALGSELAGACEGAGAPRPYAEWTARPENSGSVRLSPRVVAGVEVAWAQARRYVPGAGRLGSADALMRGEATRGDFARLVAANMATSEVSNPTQYLTEWRAQRLRQNVSVALRTMVTHHHSDRRA